MSSAIARKPALGEHGSPPSRCSRRHPGCSAPARNGIASAAGASSDPAPTSSRGRRPASAHPLAIRAIRAHPFGERSSPAASASMYGGGSCSSSATPRWTANSACARRAAQSGPPAPPGRSLSRGSSTSVPSRPQAGQRSRGASSAFTLRRVPRRTSTGSKAGSARLLWLRCNGCSRVRVGRRRRGRVRDPQSKLGVECSLTCGNGRDTLPRRGCGGGFATSR